MLYVVDAVIEFSIACRTSSKTLYFPISTFILDVKMKAYTIDFIA